VTDCRHMNSLLAAGTNFQIHKYCLEAGPYLLFPWDFQDEESLHLIPFNILSRDSSSWKYNTNKEKEE
jgi:hypothetical protein